jgi:hypothetical protein
MFCKTICPYATILALSLSLQSMAHNQNPAIIKKGISKAFETFGVPTKSKPDQKANLGGFNGTVFNVVDSTGLKAYVFQFEYNEKPTTLGVSVPDGDLKVAVMDGTTIPSSEYKDYAVFEKIRIDMIGKLRAFRKGEK